MEAKNFDITTMELIKCPYRQIRCYMKLEIHNPTIEYFIHSPYEVATDNSPFIQVGSTDEIENTYDIVETL